MLKKNSIFIKVLVPVIIIMLLQTLLISMVLFVNGTIQSLDDSAIDSMRKNAENRSISLENMMVYYWSNIDKLEMDIIHEMDVYLNANNIDVSDALGSYEHETNMLHNMSDSVLSALRLSLSTGVYIYFTNGKEYSENPTTCNGLYYRDLDPVSTPADYSDILYVRGFVDIARKDRIQLDSLWGEAFTFSPEHPDVWTDFSAPQLAMVENPDISSKNLAHWNKPHLLNPDSPLDANQFISYTKPVFYDGQLVAMIGTEVQVSYLEPHYIASDLDSFGRSGYMLVEYDQEQINQDTFDCNVYIVSGSYIKRIIGDKDEITLTAARGEGVYTIVSDDVEDVHITLQPIRLYNTNAPFSKEQWALAAIGTDSMLFETSDKAKRGIIQSAGFALLIGCIFLAYIIRRSTRSIISIAHQLENGGSNDTVAVQDSNTYEIDLLCTTINAMRDKRSAMEAQLLMERERYLIALESAADTFMEYNIVSDVFMLYYFSGDPQKPKLESKSISRFTEKIRAGEVCHPEDIKSSLLLMSAKTAEPIKARVKVSIFSHITGVQPDGKYYWFLFKASHICDDDGNIVRVIGTAKEITQEKREEYARIETMRRDPTTGFYNRDYGLELVKEQIVAAATDTQSLALCMVHINNFENFEAHYGRVFGAVILMELCRELRNDVIGNEDLAVRLSNDEFLILFRSSGKDDVQAKSALIHDKAANLYVGENADLRLHISIGAALSAGAASVEKLLACVCSALRYAEKNEKGRVAFHHDLPSGIENETTLHKDKPISVSLDISEENFVGFVFELFERTSDIHSAINMLLSVIGQRFSLHQVFVYSYDADFGVSRGSYHWGEDVPSPNSHAIEKVSVKDLADFEALLDENGTLLYTDQSIDSSGDGVKQLLCATGNSKINAYCCAMYDNQVHKGRILFISKEQDREWSNAELHSLYETTKIIAAHLNIEKSNSASRAKSEFLSRVSHEIRTPMNAIIGMTDIAKASTGKPARLADCLDKIDFSAKHLLSLINDVLDMSRIESGRLQLENSPFSLADFVAGINTLMRPPIESKKISFVINNHLQYTRVIGDENRLRQILINLLGNANKFTDPGGMIVFSIEDQEMPDQQGIGMPEDNDGDRYRYFRFSVKDNGIGISKEDQPHIFKAFEQAVSMPSSHKKQGTGLGLAICENILCLMDSGIELDSRPGEGSEFFFTIKLKLDESYIDEPAKNQECNETNFDGYLTGKRALLAEDNEINIEIASFILKDAGLQIEVAKNGQEAVDMFFASDVGYYDIILMDIQMPVMDGLDATRNIRKNRERPDARTIPIMAMTANAFDEDMKKSIESGMNGHIAKPIDTAKLHTILSQLLKKEEK